jgi:hypothetical protein
MAFMRDGRVRRRLPNLPYQEQSYANKGAPAAAGYRKLGLCNLKLQISMVTKQHGRLKCTTLTARKDQSRHPALIKGEEDRLSDRVERKSGLISLADQVFEPMDLPPIREHP